MKVKTIKNKIAQLKLKECLILRNENLSDFDKKELSKIKSKINKYNKQLEEEILK